MAETNLKNLVILLHGVGSSGSDLAALADGWKAAMPQTRFAYPDAPFASSFGKGYQWFSVAGVTEENRPGRIEAARESFDAVLSRIIAQHGLENDLDRVALVGFSQGSIMALDAIASGRWTFGAVLGFSGRLASPEPIAPTATPVLLIHGAADPVIPPTESRKAADRLASFGLKVDLVIEPNLGHSISLEGMKRGGEFIAGSLPR